MKPIKPLLFAAAFLMIAAGNSSSYSQESVAEEKPVSEAMPADNPEVKAAEEQTQAVAPPTNEVPSEANPTTEAPTTEAPTTEAPTTEAPTTEAPTTEAPKQESPMEQESPKEEPEASDISKFGPSYPLMGEFAGEITSEGEATKKIGLQIRSLGARGFEAIQYEGGLPGQPDQQGEAIELIGRRSDDFVTLSGGPFIIIVEKDGCVAFDRKGTRIGHLPRVHRESPTLGAAAPEDAIVLFDGTSTDQFAVGKISEDGFLMQGATIKPMLQDFNMHLEFRLPYMPNADGQARGNSGIYVQSRYECQVLDSFATPAVFDGLGSLYRFRKPDINMCLPPLVWQTYDIQFTAARWNADGSKARAAHITSWVNGVKVQDNIALPQKTGSGKEEAPSLLPTTIQDHGDDVRFRNIWVVDRGIASEAFPVTHP